MATAKRKRVKTNGAAGKSTITETIVLASEPQPYPDSISSSVSKQERIALLAYTYWEQRGREGGCPEEDWFRAEREILSRMGAVE